MRNRLPVVCTLLALALLAALPAAAAGSEPRVPVLVMTRPTVTQIRNVVELFERDLLPLPRLQLLCVYNDAEETDYRPAREFVETNRLDWIRFRPVHGAVALADLFRENEWTPQFREIVAASDGLLVPGGADMPPTLYGESTGLLTDPATPRRSMFDVSFLCQLLGGSRNPSFAPLLQSRPEYLVLGICLGCQSLNVATGGTLVQDIPSELYGRKTAEEVLALGPEATHDNRYLEKSNPEAARLASAFHPIHLLPGGLPCRFAGGDPAARPIVLTAHHQALDRLGQDLLPTATSLDGKIVEAIAHRRFAHVLGVQFHPEALEIHQKGAMFRTRPAGPLDFNPRQFLERNPPSTAFHQALWRWVGQVLAENAARRETP